MNVYVYKLVATFSSDQFLTSDVQLSDLLGEHNAYLDKAAEAGKVLVISAINIDAATPEAIIALYADDELEARRFMKEDPLVKANLVNATILPFEFYKTIGDAKQNWQVGITL